MTRHQFAALLSIVALALLLISPGLAAITAIAAFLLIGNQHSSREEEEYEPEDIRGH